MTTNSHAAQSSTGWSEELSEAAKLDVPEPLFQYLYDAALRSLILHSPAEIYPGPFTYKRFWFRDAVFALHAMMAAGLISRVGRLLDSFPDRQSVTGFFHSQEGEWDSNGEVLWMFLLYCKLSGEAPRMQWSKSIHRGAEWIIRKRLPADTDTPFSGLLPAGFSAEHLGPNDYYYWDDFWGVAGLRAAADWFMLLGESNHAERYRREADQFFDCIQKSLAGVDQRFNQQGMPASPFRRMDPGAIGSLVAGYPLQLFAAHDQRLLSTVDFLHGKLPRPRWLFSGCNPFRNQRVSYAAYGPGIAAGRGYSGAACSFVPWQSLPHQPVSGPRPYIPVHLAAAWEMVIMSGRLQSGW